MLSHLLIINGKSENQEMKEKLIFIQRKRSFATLTKRFEVVGFCIPSG